MKTIYKYEFKIQDEFIIEMPYESKILSVQVQNEIPCIWALVETDYAVEKRYFYLYRTGHPIDDITKSNLVYIGTFQMYSEKLVFHLFEDVLEEE